MSKVTKKNVTKEVSEQLLNTNLKELAFNFVRELSLACRKVTIYGSSHQVAARSIDKPFLLLGKIFAAKKYLNLNILRGDLYVLNISVKDDLFSRQIIHYMQMQDINAILFKSSVTHLEFLKFIDRFVKRLNISDSKNFIKSYLNAEKIESIEANSTLAYKVFEAHSIVRGDAYKEFSVRALASLQLSSDLNEIAEICTKGEKVYDKYVVDFNHEIIEYIIPEKISSIPAREIRKHLIKYGDLVHNEEDQKKRKEAIETCMALCKLVEFHPDHDEIMDNVDFNLDSNKDPGKEKNDPKSATGSIKIESNNKIEAILDVIFEANNEEIVSNEFISAFSRLLKTGQRENAISKVDFLFKKLCSSDTIIRQKALSLLVEATKSISLISDKVVFDFMVNEIKRSLTEKQETFEYSEIIWEVILKAAMERNYADIAQLTSAMAARRTVDGSVYIYDSMAVKKVFDNLNRKEVLGMFVEELIRAKYERAEQIRNILVDISSEEVALALTNIISHPARNVRQQVLKILGCLGEASVKVCSEILSEDNMFNREEGRHELPDEKWYVIRNAIFVLGILGNLTGVAALRKRISDLDVRVRREIITALEKIGGEDASDILSMMADDHIYEIQEKAVITIGLIGNSDVIPLLDNIAHSKKALSATCIISIAKIGGKEAKEYLNKLFDNQELQDTLSGGESSREDIKLALIKALGILGDKNSIKKIKEFQSIQSATQKFFFKNSSVSKIINDILSKK